KARRSTRDRIGTGLDLAASRDIAFGELEHVAESRLEFLAVFHRQPADERRILVARGEILDLPLARKDVVDHIAREIGEIGIAQRAVILKLTLQRASAHAAPFVMECWIEVR